MFGIRIVIDKLKSLASGKPESMSELVPFEYSVKIDDSDEREIDFTANVYPSRVDMPLDSGANIQALEAWRGKCNVLISGISIPVGMKYVDAKGALTKRQVEVKKIFRSDDDCRYFSGFCFLR